MNTQHLKESYLKMGKNFVTPKVKWYEFVDNRVVELSEGTGMKGESIYGVSEFVYEDSKLDTTRRGQMFFDQKLAKNYYRELIDTN